MLIDHGTFTLYTPTLPEDSPILAAKALFLKNGADADWYAIAHAIPANGHTFAMLRNGRVVAFDADPSRLWPVDLQVVETDGEVQIDWVLSGGVLAPYVPPLTDAKAARVAEAWKECQTRIEAGSIEVTTSAGTHTYGIDRVSQENIKSVLLGVLLGATPNPRPWTPRGVLSPVQLTHADLGLIGATMMSAVDAHVQAYLTHKASIMALGATAAVQAYDIGTGWPA